jgi:hypothetical protein
VLLSEKQEAYSASSMSFFMRWLTHDLLTGGCVRAARSADLPRICYARERTSRSCRQIVKAGGFSMRVWRPNCPARRNDFVGIGAVAVDAAVYRVSHVLFHLADIISMAETGAPSIVRKTSMADDCLK